MDMILAIVAGLGAAALLTSLRILREYERAVVFLLGRVRPLRGPGLVFLVPFGIERMVRVGLRIIAMDIPPQDVITRDNVSVKVNAVLYFRVSDPSKAVLEIEDYLFATSQLAQTTLRSVIGQAELDEVLAEREKFNHILQQIIDEGTDVWGIDVTGVEVKDVDLPQEMKRVIARQAEAERERRAKVINAEGELQAASRLKDAARLLSMHPASLQLRFLQTATEIAAENNSTTLFPLPIDLLTPFGVPGIEPADEAETLEELEARAKKSADEATGMTRELTSKLTGLGLLAGADLASRKARARRQAERLAGNKESARDEGEASQDIAWLEPDADVPEDDEE
jgi:regulator of protease activity HflC (stomatin/prohibitin superfamily)